MKFGEYYYGALRPEEKGSYPEFLSPLNIEPPQPQPKIKGYLLPSFWWNRLQSRNGNVNQDEHSEANDQRIQAVSRGDLH